MQVTISGMLLPKGFFLVLAGSGALGGARGGRGSRERGAGDGATPPHANASLSWLLRADEHRMG